MNGKNEVRVDITADPSGLKKGSREARQDLQQLAGGHDEAAQATKRHTSTALEFIKGLAGYDILKSAALWMKNLATETTLLAARQETLGVVLGVVGRNVGLSGKEMQAYADQVRAMGITTLASRETVVRMVQAQMDLTKASQLARVAQDAAVIGNINSSEAFQRMIYAIQSAQPEMLRVLGLNVNFERSYARMAEAIGKTANDLTETEKVQIRTNLVLQAGTRITGAYEGAMNTAGKQLNSLARYHEDLKVVVGQTFNEALVIAVNSYTDALKEASVESEKLAQAGKLKEWGRDVIRVSAWVADALTRLWGVFRTGVEMSAVAVLESANRIRTGLIDMFPGGRQIREFVGQATGQDIDAYVEAFRERAVANVLRRDREKGRFQREAEAFFAQQDADAARQAAEMARRPPRPRGGGEDAAGGGRRGKLRGQYGSPEYRMEMAEQSLYAEAQRGIELVNETNRKEAQKTFKVITVEGRDAFDDVKAAVDDFGREMSRSLARGEEGFRGLQDAASRFLEELLAIQLQKRLVDPALKAGTAYLDSLFAGDQSYGGGGMQVAPDTYGGYAAPFHGGGIAGAGGGTRRRVHPAVFAYAPRFHRGGEIPAILQAGEEVLTRRDPRHVRNGGAAPEVTVNVINQTGQPVQAQASAPRIDATGAVVDLVLRGLSTNAGARDQLAGMLQRPRH